MIVRTEKPSLADLAHYGVRGMKWGVRRNGQEMTRSEKQARVKKLNKKMDSVDMDNALMGIGLIGGAAQKLNKRALRKNPDFDVKGKTLSDEEYNARELKAVSKAKRQVVTAGVLNVASILAVGGIAVSALAGNGASAKTVAMGRQGVLAMGAIPIKMRYSELRAINAAVKRQRILEERIALERQLKKGAS